MTYTPLQRAILSRRSVFPASYLDREIPQEALLRILECAHAAPTHKRTQPWQFHVVQKASLPTFAKTLGEAYKRHTSVENYTEKKQENIEQKVLASGAIIVISVRYSEQVPEWEELAATACAVQNLWLAAASENIGGYWSTPGFVSALKEDLGLSSQETCLGLFYLGYHEEPQREALRNPLDAHVHWI